LIEVIRRIIQKFQLIPPDSKIVIGVSGGADSLALLHILYTLQPTLHCQIHVATLDHGLRGEQSMADAHYVKQIAESWGIPVTMGQTDVRGLAAQTRIGIEAAARLARYDFLATVAREVNAGHVAVAHHADDQAETVLMHLIRGAGVGGLGGMALQSPMPGHPELTLIRPLLWVTRAEIERYCLEYGLQPRVDVTNRDTTLLRNYIRWEIVPRLEKLNPNIQRALAQTADILQVEDDYVEHQLEAFVFSPAVEKAEYHIKVNRKAFRDLHPALRRRLVAWAARQIRPSIQDLDYPHIVNAVEIGLRGRQGARALLTDGLQLRIDYDSLVIEDENTLMLITEQPLLSDQVEIRVQIPGVTPLLRSQWSLHASLRPVSSALTDAPHRVARLAISETAIVTLRGLREGDWFAPMGMDGHRQKLNRWMINHKIPRHLRDEIPFLCVNGEIAGIFVNPRWFVGEAYKVRNDSQRVVYFQFLQNL